ncbi:MAG: hypothetical protein ACYCZJ_05595 [Sulfuriferula sp.]
MLETTKQDTDIPTQNRAWVEAAVWTGRMLAALDNGVQGGKWFSLMDKVYRPEVMAAGAAQQGGGGRRSNQRQALR